MNVKSWFDKDFFKALTILILIIFFTLLYGFFFERNNINLFDSDNDLNGLKYFSNTEDLEDYLNKKNDLNSANLRYSSTISRVVGDISLETSDDIRPISDVNTAVLNTDVSSKTVTDYSTTNVQVVGVDEADIVKTDGEYIYTISNNDLVIVKTRPSNELKEVSRIVFKKKPVNLFVKGEKLVVFSESYNYKTVVSKINFVPGSKKSFLETNVLIFDIGNRTNPVQVKNFSFSGDYYESRLIGDYVYLISKENFYYRGIDFLPSVYEDNSFLRTNNVFYFDDLNGRNTFQTISSIDLKNFNVESKSFLLDDYATVYFSKNNIYLTYDKKVFYDYPEIFRTQVLPLMPLSVKNEVSGVILTDSNYLNKVSEILRKYYDSLNSNDRVSVVDEVNSVLNEYYIKFSENSKISVIQKFGVNRGEVNFLNKGEVNGYLLNQFSLDEGDDGSLRLATNTNFWNRTSRRSVLFNNVFVLDNDLNLVGSLTDLAKGEKIYSTRFLGDKLFMVTFRQIDPLFVIDLSESNNPKVLGELKIPGYSTYLHPFGSDFLIGLGYGTIEFSSGSVVNDGIKLSLFDVSNYSNPIEVDNYTISGRYTDSIATREHKAFLFSESKNLLVIPVRKYDYDNGLNKGYYSYDFSAFVFNLTESGFGFRGSINHKLGVEGYNYWYKSPYSISRSLYVSNDLYTISENKILVNSLVDLSKLGEVDLSTDYTVIRPSLK